MWCVKLLAATVVIVAVSAGGPCFGRKCQGIAPRRQFDSAAQDTNELRKQVQLYYNEAVNFEPVSETFIREFERNEKALVEAYGEYNRVVEKCILMKNELKRIASLPVMIAMLNSEATGFQMSERKRKDAEELIKKLRVLEPAAKSLLKQSYQLIEETKKERLIYYTKAVRFQSVSNTFIHEFERNENALIETYGKRKYVIKKCILMKKELKRIASLPVMLSLLNSKARGFQMSEQKRKDVADLLKKFEILIPAAKSLLHQQDLLYQFIEETSAELEEFYN